MILAGACSAALVWEWNRHWQSCPVRIGQPATAAEAVDRTAPDFELPMADGEATFRLRDFRGHKPVALIFGSYTCPFIRRRSAELERLYREYGDEVQFCFVYTRETHPADEAPVPENEVEGIRLAQTTSSSQRRQRCMETLGVMGLSIPAVIDSQNDEVARKYDSMPTIRMHLIDTSGQIVYRSHGMLPFTFSPAELESEILKLVDHESDAARALNDS